MVTDVVNGLNLYWGPSNATMNETEGVNDTMDNDTGRIRIRKAHPIWGISTLTIPFIPMMIVCPMSALTQTDEKGTCVRILAVLLSLLLFLPFSAVFTPIYILAVCGWGIKRIIMPTRYPDPEDVAFYGFLKTLEISVESAIQTCLGKK